MSAWVDLGLGILQEFREAALQGRDGSRRMPVTAWLVAHEDRVREYQREWHYESGRHNEIMRRRRARLAEAPACANCGGVIPKSDRGPLPTHCSKRCRGQASDRKRRMKKNADQQARREKMRLDRICA